MDDYTKRLFQQKKPILIITIVILIVKMLTK